MRFELPESSKSCGQLYAVLLLLQWSPSCQSVYQHPVQQLSSLWQAATFINALCWDTKALFLGWACWGGRDGVTFAVFDQSVRGYLSGKSLEDKCIIFAEAKGGNIMPHVSDKKPAAVSLGQMLEEIVSNRHVLRPTLFCLKIDPSQIQTVFTLFRHDFSFASAKTFWVYGKIDLYPGQAIYRPYGEYNQLQKLPLH